MSWANCLALMVVSLAAVFALLPGVARAANEAGNLDQCSNGTVSAPNSCPPGWVNGNLNENSSHYAELDSVPFRITLTNLTAGAHTLVIQYDAIQSSKHAYDYLTSFGRTVPGVDPCSGVAGCSGAPLLADLPLDPRVFGPGWGGTPLPQSLRQVAGWNVTGLTATLGGSLDTSDQQSVTFTFSTSGANTTAVLAWAGHIGSQINWGSGNAAGNIPGSPYHMRLIALDGAGGNQDRSLKASAITPVVPVFFTDVSGVDANGNVTLGSSVTDTASLTGTASNGAPSGSVQFAVCGPNTSNPDCSTVANFSPTHILTPDSPVLTAALSGSAVSPSFTPTAAGHYCFRAIYTPDAFAIYSPTEETNQTTETSDASVHGECFTVSPATPSIATTASAATTVGGSISDSVVLSGGSSPTGTITVKVYGPNDANCSGAVLFSDDITVSGNGTYASPSHTVNAAGTYRFWASYSGDSNNGAVAGACNQANESVVVGPASPAIATTASTATTVGHDISDSVVLSGGVSPTGTITVKIYGPNDANCSGPVLFSDNITVSGNGTYPSPAHTINTAGTYRFWASYSGDSNNNAIVGACNQANESVVVGPASPAIATTASAATTVGGSISDSVVLSGGVSPTGKLTVKIYGPNDANCSGAVLFSDDITVSGNGTYPSPSHTINAAGTYRFVASYSGDSNNNPVAGACNQDNESVVVGPASPSIATTASAGVDVGGSIHDSVALSGGFNPTGTITVKVYGPNDANCSGAVLFSDDITVSSGNGTYPSPSHTINAAGTYRFVASYSGDSNNSPIAGACNQANESVTVGPKQPTVATTASDSVVVGGSIHDSVVLSGGSSPTGTITVKAYGPNDANCSGAVLFSDDITVSGNGTYPSPAHEVDAAGTYRFVASYSGDSNNNPVAGACNQANESVDVTKATPSISTQGSDSVVVGGLIHDTVTFGGGFNPTGTITVNLYAPGDTTCSTVVGTDTITVPGNGSPYTSKDFATSAVGTYRFVASYSGDANNKAVSGSCNDEGESVAVTQKTPSVATTASDSVEVGGSINDSVTLSDGFNPTGTLTVKVYGPNDANCSGDVLFTDSITVSNGNGTYPSPAHQINTAGTYRFVASYSGDANNAAVAGACNQANESVDVTKATPALSTTASDDVVVGDSLSDTAHLSGGFSPTGFIVFSLYGPNDPNCDGEPVFTDAQPVDGAGDYTSEGFPTTDAGTYHWTAEYQPGNDPNNNGVTEGCGGENESATAFKPSISITKDPKSQSIDSGGTATFTITVKNTGDIALSNVTVTDAQAPNCAKVIGDLAPGESSSYTCTLAGVTSPFTNSATATGHPRVGPDVSATDTAAVTVNAVPPPPPPPPPPPVVHNPVIDLQITKTDSPDPDVLGNALRYTIIVRNNGPDTAHNVQMSDPLPVGVSFTSVSTTQGTCTGGQLISCQLGTLNNGASVTITVFVKTLQTGIVVNTATTVGQEAESNTANNTATATTLVKGPFTPPAVITGCYAVAVSPHSLTAGKRSTLTLSVHTLGKPAKNARVRITGAGINKTTGPTNAKGIVRVSVKPAKPGILRFQPLSGKQCGAPRIGVIGAFTPPVTG